MGKRMTKKEIEALIYVLPIIIVLGLIIKFFQAVGFVIPTIAAAIGGGIWLYVRSQKEKARQKELEDRRARLLKEKEERQEYLLQKYGDKEIVEKIMSRTVWVGQTDGQLVDSLGAPEDIDQKVLKTKKKEVWKYYHVSGNRYGLRVTLDNDEVIGWDEKM